MSNKTLTQQSMVKTLVKARLSKSLELCKNFMSTLWYERLLVKILTEKESVQVVGDFTLNEVNYGKMQLQAVFHAGDYYLNITFTGDLVRFNQNLDCRIIDLKSIHLMSNTSSTNTLVKHAFLGWRARTQVGSNVMFLINEILKNVQPRIGTTKYSQNFNYRAI